jgi:aminocarboxymuconate-semialdehyde decarboxylase
VAAIDVHTHMVSRQWLDLLERDRGTYAIESVAGDERVITRAGTPFMTLTPEMFDYDARIANMDAAGVDLSVVSLTCPNVYWGDAETSLAAARLSNDDMTAASGRFPQRLRWFASLPWQHPELAIAELDRCLAAGAVGVMVLANIDGVSLTDPRFARVWEAIDAHALPVLVHPTTPPGIDQLDLSRYHLAWSVGFTADTTIALARMIMDGFFDRYRQVKIIGGHGGGYLPYLIGRLDAGYRYFPSTRTAINRKPSEYLDQIWVDSITYSPDALALAIKVFGASHVLYGSDYPHKCGEMDVMLELVDTQPADQAALIRSDNAQKIFNF